MDIDLDAGIKRLDEIELMPECKSQIHKALIWIFREVLEAMRKPSQGQDPCEETFETKQSDLNKIYGICVHPACRHKDAEIQLLNKELEITKKLLYIATGEVNNQADKNEKLKNRLAEADDLLNNPNTITIDRKVAESWLRVKPLNFMSAADIQLYGEFKRALGENG